MADGDYYFTVRRILIIILAINMIVAVVKGLYGFLTQSLSMTTDGLHSFFDSTSNIVGLIGLYLASRPADKEHPYGHSKFETFASIGVVVLLFATCFQVLGAAINRFLNPISPDITFMSFVIMGFTLIINVAVSAYEYILGRRLGSSILVADSRHTRSDIYASIAVIFGFIVVKMGYPLADPIISVFITGLIILTGLDIIKESSEVLLDKALIEESVVKRIAESVPGVCDCHRVRTRGAKREMFIDLHIGLDSSLSVEQGHEVGTAVEDRIKSSIEGVKDVVVHMEPKEYCRLKAGK
jgi:cation diffusion facilitator family transporter